MVISHSDLFQIMSRSKPLHDHAALTIICSVALGLSPLHITKQAGKSVLAVNSRWPIISGGYFLFNALIITVTLVNLPNMALAFGTKNLAFLVGMAITFEFKAAMYIVYIVACKCIWEYYLLEIINDLTEVYNALNEIGMKRHYWRDVFYQIVHVLITPVIYSILYTITMVGSGNNFNRPIAMSVFDVYVYFFVKLLDNQFILLLLVIKQTFSAINNGVAAFGKSYMCKSDILSGK